jgi:hypothetical protein
MSAARRLVPILASGAALHKRYPSNVSWNLP